MPKALPTMTPRENVRNLLKKKPFERVAFHDHIWADTQRRWVGEGYPGEPDRPEDPGDHFGFDIVMFNGIDPMPIPGYEGVLDEAEDWVVHLVDTGTATNTGGRVLRLREWLEDEAFLLTYGDGVSDVDLTALAAFHERQGAAAPLPAVRPPARFGAVALDGDRVRTFAEKPQMSEGWIHGGYMVLEPAVFDELTGDDVSLEARALERLASRDELRAYRHDGFWQCMDTLRDKRYLEALWAGGSPPWKVW